MFKFRRTCTYFVLKCSTKILFKNSFVEYNDIRHSLSVKSDMHLFSFVIFVVITRLILNLINHYPSQSKPRNNP